MRISRQELAQAQMTLLVAIGLQVMVYMTNHQLLLGPQYILLPTELFLVFTIGFMTSFGSMYIQKALRSAALVLLGMISLANFSSLVLVLHRLVIGSQLIDDSRGLLASAVAIFLTNIIVFGLFYWEIDSPGLSHQKWSNYDKDFQFTQHDFTKEFPNWKPVLADYLYLSITNAVNFAPADTRPITVKAKLMMAAQALISVAVLAIVIAKSVSVIGI